MRSWLYRVLVVCAVLVFTGQSCTKKPSAETIQASQSVTLRVWGVVDDADAYEPVFQAYQAEHPHVSFDYRRFRLEEYERELVDALAEDRGPDLFLIHNDWLGKYVPKITPMPSTTRVAYSVITGTLKKEKTWQLRAEPTMALRTFKERFADAAVRDTVRTVNVSEDPERTEFRERVLGMPVGVDTLALYYNKDLLNAAGIPTPPDTWTQFQEQVAKLVKLDAQGNILQAAAGIGTANNVERGIDILMTLMMQNGAMMADESGTPRFTEMPEALKDKRAVPPAMQALEFYTDFANPAKETYTWNNQMPNSLEAFIRGTSAFFFGYSYQFAQIKARAPKINLGLARMPQIEGSPSRHYANYWFWTVSRKSKNQDLAWHFLNFLAKPDQTKSVLEAVARPAAQRALLSAQLDDERVGVFASQVLTAVSWYRGRDPFAMEAAFQELINNMLANPTRAEQWLDFAATKIEQTIR